VPALPPAPNILKIGLRWLDTAGNVAQNRQYWIYSGVAPTPAVCSQIAQDCYGFAVTNLIPLASSDWSLEEVTVTDLSSSTAGAGSYSAATPGTRIGAPLPADAAFMTNEKIARRYRGGKPRTYWPFGTGPDVGNPGFWNTVSLGQLNSGVGAYNAAVQAETSSGTILGQEYSVSFYEGFTAVTNPITGRTRDVPKVRSAAVLDPIIARAGNPRIASQRRRTGIRG